VTDLRALPGADLVAVGLADLRAGEETVPALLVAIASRRLRSAGLPVPEHSLRDAELHLYRALSRDGPEDAYSRYNALLRVLTSFAHALEREQGEALRQSRGVSQP
jgi:hypothetical protein